MNNQQHLETLLSSLREDINAVPDMTYRKNSRIRLLNSVNGSTSRTPSSPGYSIVNAYAWRFAIAPVLLVALILFAAQSSFPNSPIYPVKVLGERIALSLAPTKSIKTGVANSIVDRRFDEIEHAQKSGDRKTVTQSIVNYEHDINNILKMQNVSQATIEHTLSEHEELLREIHKDIPDTKRNIDINDSTEVHSGSNEQKRDDEESAKPTIKPIITPTATPSLQVLPTIKHIELQHPDVKGDSTHFSHDDD